MVTSDLLHPFRGYTIDEFSEYSYKQARNQGGANFSRPLEKENSSPPLLSQAGFGPWLQEEGDIRVFRVQQQEESLHTKNYRTGLTSYH